MREGSMKFPVAPQSMRAVVVMVLTLYHNRMGNHKACSDLLAMITEAMSRGEEDVTVSSHSKKTVPWFHQHLPRSARGVTTQQVSFLFPPVPSHISTTPCPPGFA